MNRWQLHIRGLALFALGFIAAVAGLYFGEEGKLSPIALAAPFLFGAIAAFVTKSSAWRRVGAALLTASLFGIGLYAGNDSFSHAYNSCIEQGEELRASLAQHFVQHGSFPSELAQLSPKTPRCDRVLRGSILKYELINGGGYRLSFSDLLVSHTANELEPFEANK